MSILITGGAGFIGSHVCETLLENGEAVVALDSFDDFYDPSIKESNLIRARSYDEFRLVRGDIRDPEAFATLPPDIDAVIHLAARAGVRPSIEQPVLYSDVNVMGTVQLLAWLKERGIRRLVFASSSSVYGNNEKIPFAESDPVDHPISPYAATKKSGELICHASSSLDSVAVACLRFFTVYGPRQRPDLAIHKFARLLKNGQPIPMFGDGSASRDYTYIDDTVSGVLAALEWTSGGSYGVFNLGNHRTVRLDEMIEVIAGEMGATPTIHRLPMQPGDVDRTYADVTLAREAFGYAPQTDFTEGVRKFLDWFNSQSQEQ